MSLRIIIDVNHPAHVHLFKHFAYKMLEKGNEVLFTALDKEDTFALLKAYNLPFYKKGPHRLSLFAKAFGVLKNDLTVFNIARKFRPHILISSGSLYAAHVSFLIHKPHITMEDTGNMEQVVLYRPFTEVILTPSCFDKNLGNKQITYNGYHELAYLHPAYFRPNKDILTKLNIKEGEKFVLLRFIKWGATHDIGQHGFNDYDKIRIVSELSDKAKVFISSEGVMPEKLNKYRLNISPEDMLSALQQATVVVSEGAKTVAEAAVLGTPAFYISTCFASQIKEMQDKYQLIYHYSNGKNLVEKVLSLLEIPDLKEAWRSKKNLMLKEKIDVTKFMVWFIENYPESVKIMQQDKEFQLQFR